MTHPCPECGTQFLDENLKQPARAPQVDGTANKPEASELRKEVLSLVQQKFCLSQLACACTGLCHQMKTDAIIAAINKPAAVDEKTLKEKFFYIMTNTSFNIGGHQKYLWASDAEPFVDNLMQAIRPYLRTPSDKAATIEKMARAMERILFSDNTQLTQGTVAQELAKAAYEAEHERNI